MQNDYAGILKRDGMLVFVPGGNSMWPTLKNEGQAVLIMPKEGKLNLYDVPLYRRTDGSYVLHRVIGFEKDGYIICGDSQFQEEFVSDGQIVGVMKGFYKGKKFVEADDPRGYKRALFLRKHPFLKRVALKFYYTFRRKKR